MKNKEVERGLFAASGFYLLAAVGLILVAFCASALGSFLINLFPDITPEWMSLVVNVLYYGLFILIPVSVWALRRPAGAEWLRLNPLSLGATIRTALIAVACVSGAYFLTMLWTILWQELGLNVFVSNYIRPQNTAELTRSVLSVAVVTAISEELLFRGVMLTAWENRGVKQGVCVTALLFALLHGSILGFPAELACGVVLALLVRWTNSLYAGMIFHSTYNAALVMLNYVLSAGETGEAAAVRLFETLGFGGILQVLFLAVLSGMFAWGLLWKFQIVFRFRQRTSKLLDEELLRRALQQQRRDALSGEGAEVDLAEQSPIFASAPMTCREPLSAGIVVLMMAGALSVLVLYGLDLWSMLL